MPGKPLQEAQQPVSLSHQVKAIGLFRQLPIIIRIMIQIQLRKDMQDALSFCIKMLNHLSISKLPQPVERYAVLLLGVGRRLLVEHCSCRCNA